MPPPPLSWRPGARPRPVPGPRPRIGLGSARGGSASALDLVEVLLLGERVLGRAHGLRVGLRRRFCLGPLGLLDRRELLLRRQLAAFGDDESLHLGRDALEDVHRDR